MWVLFVRNVMCAAVPSEIVVFMKKLILAGVIVFVDPGSITQLYVAREFQPLSGHSHARVCLRNADHAAWLPDALDTQ